MDRNMMLTPDEYLALKRIIDSERESEGARLSQEAGVTSKSSKRKSSAYQRRYKAAFKKIAPSFKLRSGRWKKNGFRMAVRTAHKMAKK